MLVMTEKNTSVSSGYKFDGPITPSTKTVYARIKAQSAPKERNINNPIDIGKLTTMGARLWAAHERERKSFRN